MAYTTVQNSIYNYYLSTYGSKDVTKYDTHKRSELRSIYNSMVKLNTDSPLYLIPNVKDAAQSAIDFKEMARTLRNDIASLGGLNENQLLNQKTAFSSNEAIASAEYIGNSSESLPESIPAVINEAMPEAASTDAKAADGSPFIKLSVKNLASNQVNLGEFLSGNSPVSLPANTYSFDITIRNLSYEFQFNINKGDTNRDIQKRLSRLISNSGIGLSSKVIEGSGDMSALQIASDTTGLPDQHSEIFTVSDEQSSKNAGAVDYLGLNYTAIEPVNAVVLVNGQERQYPSNQFTLDDEYDITLHGVSPSDGESTIIGVKKDYESLADNISKLAESFNRFTTAVASYRSSTGTQFNTARFEQEINGMLSYYKNNLNAIGAYVSENGTIQVDQNAVKQAAQEPQTDNRFQIVRSFANQLVRKTGQISLDPMQYVSKKIVAYKNPGHNYSSPYVSSSYSGMLFNYYC